MHQKQRPRNEIASVGWLFADMLLVLTMLFFALAPAGKTETTSTCVATPIPGNSLTPLCTPIRATATTQPPTPTSLPRLELKHLRIILSVDPTGVLNDDPQAISSIEQQVQAQNQLHNRNAGLVIAYGGAPNASQVDTALEIADKIYTILKKLGQRGYVFSRASYYDPLYLLGGSLNTATIDVYLFAR